MEIFCSVCGISGKMRGLFEVISQKGVIFACEKCVSEEGFPVLKRPDKSVFEAAEKKGKVSDVMARLSGVRPKEKERPELKMQEKSLREIVNSNYEEKIKMQDLRLKSRPDLIDKFHWIIMRVRRVRGLTQKQLAEAINETEAAIKMAEQGLVPEGYELMDKIEGFLNVRLIRERTSSMLGQSKEETRPSYAELRERNIYPISSPEKRETRPKTSVRGTHVVSVVESEEEKQRQQTYSQKILSLDRKNIGSLTIADLHRMKKEREAEMLKAELEDGETEEVIGEEPPSKEKTRPGVVKFGEEPVSKEED